MSKRKFYVVWKGRKTGVFTSWNACKRQIDGFEGAQYKSFASLDEAEIASTKNYEDYKGKNTKKPTLSASEIKKYGKPILESIAVDAACAGNPGKMEYRGVLTHNKKQLFIPRGFAHGFVVLSDSATISYKVDAYYAAEHNEGIAYNDPQININWRFQKSEIILSEADKNYPTLANSDKLF